MSSIAIIKNFFHRARRNREFQIIVFMNFIAAAGGLVANRLLTKYVSSHELGTVFLLGNTATWLALPASCLYLVNLHQWPVAKESGQLSKYARFIDKSVFYFFFFAIFASLALFFNNWLSITSGALLFSLLFIATGQGVFQILSPILLVERRRITSGVLEILFGNMGKYFFVVAGVVFLGRNEFTTVVQLQAFHCTLIASICFLVYKNLFKKTLKSYHGVITNASLYVSRKSIFSYLIPNLLAALTTQIATTAERWSLNSVLSKESISFFVLSVGLSTAASGALGSIVGNYFYPQIVNEFVKFQNSPAFKRISRKFIISTILTQSPLLVIFWFFPQLLTRIFFASSYEPIAQILGIVFVGAFCFALSSSITQILYSLQKTVPLRIINMIVGLVYALVLILMAYYGLLDVKVAAMLYAGYQFLIFISTAALYFVPRA